MTFFYDEVTADHDLDARKRGQATLDPFNDGGQWAWDSTSLNLAETCLRKYYYTMVEGWRHITSSVHLEFGGHYATALEHFHRHLANGTTHDDAVIAIVDEALQNTWNSQEGIPIDWDHPAKTRLNLIRTIVWYTEQFRDDPCQTIILSDGRPAVEYSFKMELSDEYLYCGHIDRLVEYAGDVYVQDQKTTGSTLSSYYFTKFSPDTQMSGYTLAGSAVYAAPIKGVMIDAAQIAVNFSRFERGFTFRTPAQLTEWREDSLAHIGFARAAFQVGYWPQNRSSCDKYGGCAFRTVCSRSPEVRPQFLRAEFRQQPIWNPLQART